MHRLGVQPGTTPAIAAVSGGYQIAFQADNHDLWTTGPYGTRNLHLGMKADTDPSITAVPGGYQIAFQANTGKLYTTGKYGTHDLGLGMGRYGHPSIAAVTGGYVIAFKANTGKAWLAGTTGHRDLGIQMDTYANESPSIAAHATSWEIALMSNLNEIWTATSTAQVDTRQVSADLTSPSITWAGTGGYDVSFVTNTVPSHPVFYGGTSYVDTHSDVSTNTSVASAYGPGLVTAYISANVPAVVVNGQYFGIP